MTPVPESTAPSDRPGRGDGAGRAGRFGRVVMVAAYAENRVIGDAGGIPWHLPEDFAHFKAITMGQTLVMGRRTYESIGRPLPGRTTIVVTRDPDWGAEGVIIVRSLEAALTHAAALDGDTVIAGGSQIYEQAMPHATHQVLTEVHRSPPGDTHYPAFDAGEWRETRREAHEGFDLVWWERR
ncbi:dihydrofolate reductase [Nocardioides donggukensis]|uniref:Dihydrofolate reductase n=1 Tax=Nocardioides donggukensis TaxID=2774019 RepID=A0A927PZW9_9ACTN|nr:dihydrofolate reductase [Nocardioides donggukensis]MBD8869850.1 dihydrofolate reductase [Nocardioides donggukensis]